MYIVVLEECELRSLLGIEDGMNKLDWNEENDTRRKSKSKSKKILDDINAYHFSPQTGGYGKSGIPDIIACYKGRFIAIECKAGKGTLTALQKYNIDQIISRNGLAIVINEGNMQELLTLIKEIA
jgi:hypothetical protein